MRGNPDWQFEAIAYYVQLPDLNGSCTSGTQPLHRLCNNGRNGATNHRFATSVVVRNETAVQGRTPEGYGPLGAIACVPL